MNLRKLEKEDITKVAEIIHRNFDEVMVNKHSKEVLERFKKLNTCENLINQMSWKEIFVVEENDNIIATGALANFGDDSNPKYCISNFFVEPEYHGAGIGKRLINYLIEIAKTKGITLLHVPSSRTGLGFYKKMGFVEDNFQNDTADEITWMTLNIKS